MNLPELLPGTLDSGVSNEVVPSDMLLEFRGVADVAAGQRSDRNYLYFFLKM